MKVYIVLAYDLSEVSVCAAFDSRTKAEKLIKKFNINEESDCSFYEIVEVNLQ